MQDDEYVETTDALDDYQPKFSAEQEQAIIGSLMLDFKLKGVLIEHQVTPAHFFLPSSQMVMAVMMDDANKFETLCDPISIARQLEARGELEAVGGMAKLSQYYTDLPRFVAPETFRRWVLGVKEDAKKRLLGRKAQDMLNQAQNGVAPKEIVSRLHAEISWMLEDEHRPEEDMLDLLEAMDQNIVGRREKPTGVRMGIPYIDHRLGGLQPGHVVVLAALAGEGKTTNALQAALSFLQQKVTTAVLSLEMQRSEITEKLVMLHSELGRDPFQRGRFTDSQKEKYRRTISWLAQQPLRIRDQSYVAPTIDAVEREIENLAALGVKAVVLDYLGLLRVPGARSDNRAQEVASMSRRLKNLAQKTQVTILLLVQLKRDADSRKRETEGKYGGRRRRKLLLSDLADSSGVERDADQVIFVQTDEDDGQSGWSDATIEIKKNRHGRCGSLDGQLNRKLGKYEWEQEA